ncbi:uncharacterized protein KIAA0513 isoform X3 [Oratosquilla oratoria]|uniref:uncharacterized protein KIAA0513 isoform X3 n=1 Tax=Oratosquilla oratoria TaxID=337810 RepID=UPI003F766B5A
MATAANDSRGFFKTRLRSVVHTSNDLLSGISSRFSVFSMSSDPAPPVQEEEPPRTPPLQLPPSPEDSNKSPTVKEMIKETFKLENLKEFRPTLEDLILSESSEEPSTLPTNTPESPKGFKLGNFKLSNLNQALPKKLENYKAMAIRTWSGEGGGGSDSAANSGTKQPCAIKVELVESNSDDKENEATSSGSPSDGDGLGHSTSLDSSDSDPHKKLWIRSGSQNSLQSWASSLSYDSQAEEVNETREFTWKFVDDVFKNPPLIDVDRKARFGELAQTEQGRLWFARCINAKRCCKCVSEATFFSLIQHFSVMLFECAEADDFSPAKSLMNMCFTFYHEVLSPEGQRRGKEFLYIYLRQQPIWRSMRFWNAAFFDALQCERSMRPVVTREEVENNRLQALTDELHYQENITFGQLGTFTCNMHAFGLSKEMCVEFLRKQVTIASLRQDQVKLLRDNIDRMYSGRQEWQ